MDNKVTHQPEKPHGTSGENRYVYEHLRTRQSVRFLVLQPGSGSEPLVGRLQVESIKADIEQLPPYEAISYVWGAGDRSFKLICDGDTLPLTQSIHDALIRVRLSSQPRRLWADQVCINQDDIPERSQQVKLMNLIYKNAERVLVWLGRDLDGVAESARHTVYYLDKVFKDDKAHAEFQSTYEENLATQSPDPWIPLAKLTELPWFRRLWIVQEIGTAAPATLYWGAIEMDWDTLSFVAAVLSEKYYHFRTQFRINTSSMSYLRRRFVEPDSTFYDCNKGNFAYELHKARPLLGQDPRDRIYAFLGHFSINNGGKELQNISADYSKKLKDVYIDVAVRVLSGAEDLLILSSTHPYKSIFNTSAPKNKEHLGLPSWVPDWRYLPLHIFNTPSVPHRASRATRPDLTIDEDARILHIRGVRIDVIVKSSWEIHGSAFQIRQGAHEAQQEKKDLGSQLHQKETEKSSGDKRALNSKNNNDNRSQQKNSPSHQQRKSEERGRHIHDMEALWKNICGYGKFCLTFPYRPFLKRSPSEKATDSASFSLSSSSSSVLSSMSPHGHRRSAFFAFVQTLTNGCVSFDRSRPYSAISSEEFLASGAAYLVRYAQSPPTPSSSSSRCDPVSPAIHILSRNGDPFRWSHQAVLFTRRRRFAVTDRGYFVLGPGVLQKGDVVVVLRGGKIPFLLRRVSTTANSLNDIWMLVGECYVHGLMDGEGWNAEGVKEELFPIQ